MAILGEGLSAKQGGNMIQPDINFIRLPIDTIHRRLKEFSERKDRSAGVWNAVSTSVAFLCTLMTSTFHDIGAIPASFVACFFWGVLFINLVFICYRGWFWFREYKKRSVDYVIKQLTGQVDVETYPKGIRVKLVDID